MSLKPTETITADFIVIGGGTAGLMAAILLKQRAPDLAVQVVEKANAVRSGCLAMGLNAVNLYLTDNDVDAYVDYVTHDNYRIVREDLVRTIGERANKFVPMLESFGVPFPRDEQGNYVKRSRRSIMMYGEQLKPLLYKKALESGVAILNHTPVSELIRDHNGRVIGVSGFNLRTSSPVRVFGRAVLSATGGAGGIYRHSNSGAARKKSWYSPFNAGSGMAMGIRCGAEMTSFEMRFIALRTKDITAPTGTMVLGTRVRQVNSRFEEYLKAAAANLGRSLTTSERLFYQGEEDRNGRGPCLLDLSDLDPGQYEKMASSYLNMSPSLVLQLLENPAQPLKHIEVAGSEPYINGGHGLAGFWISIHRQTTIDGLYAAGDTAGGAPKKYITGCFAEAEIAVEHFLSAMPGMPATVPRDAGHLFAPLAKEKGLNFIDVEDRLQKVMDEYAGGYSMNYDTDSERLTIARRKLEGLTEKLPLIKADHLHDLMRAHEVSDKVLLARVLVEHMMARRETRWPVYQSRLDFPGRDDSRFSVFINSKVEDGRIKVFHRSLDRPYNIMQSKGASYA
ncbi:MAG: adenylyl-sulfate reductase subunit alpha [bacterium]|nr:adenylyl-sulfate reductase subunit alpha [bacterium]